VIVVTCAQCKKLFKTKPSKNASFCSRKCSAASRKRGRIVPCFLCGKEVYKQAKAITSSKRLFCSKTCSVSWHNQEFKDKKHGNWKNGIFSYKRLLERSEVEKSCSRCGVTETSVLVAHHLDHNRTNNVLGNLAWLCRNCHHLIHVYPAEEVVFLEQRKEICLS